MFVLNLCSVFFGSAMAAPLSPAVKVQRVVPPSTVFEGVSRIEVDRFDGWNGEAVASDLRQALQDPERSGGRDAGGGLLGDLVELGVDALGAEVENAVGGIGGKLLGGLVGGGINAVAGSVGAEVIRVDDGLKADVYQLVTSEADAKVSGTITVSDKVDSFKAKQAKRDGNGKVVKDSKGKTVYVEVPCKKRTVTTDIRWRIVDGSGNQLGERSFPRRVSDTACGSSIGSLASKDELAGKTLTGIGARIANEFAPYWATERIDFKRSKELKEVMELHRKDQPQLALCAAREVAAQDAYNVEAMLAVGAFHEGLGYVSAATEHYQKAASVNNDKTALERLQGAQQRQREIEALRTAYNLEYTVGDPDYSMCPEIPEGQAMITRKPVQLWSDRDPSAASKVADLPKGVKVYMVEEGPDMMRVVTLSGDEGWVEAKSVK